MKKILLVCLVYLTTIQITVYGQAGFTLSVPVIYGKVELTNNWSPPTAINRHNQFDGTSLWTAINLDYSFDPTFLIKNKKILMNIGLGYFNQQFNVKRPFDYNSPLQPMFYTDNYAYYGLQGTLGMSYNYSLRKNYFLSGNLSYSWLRSFRQEYTFLYTYLGSDRIQVNNNQIDFGNMLILSIGIYKHLGSKLSLGLDIIAPLYTCWRNDKIFKDDPSKFSHPKYSFGSSLSITYRLKTKHQP